MTGSTLFLNDHEVQSNDVLKDWSSFISYLMLFQSYLQDHLKCLDLRHDNFRIISMHFLSFVSSEITEVSSKYTQDKILPYEINECKITGSLAMQLKNLFSFMRLQSKISFCSVYEISRLDGLSIFWDIWIFVLRFSLRKNSRKIFLFNYRTTTLFQNQIRCAFPLIWK